MTHLPTVSGKKTSGGRRGQVDGKRATVFLVMVWELLSLELLLCHVHVFASYNLQLTTDIPISFMFEHIVLK